jgi:hypothetical protein
MLTNQEQTCVDSSFRQLQPLRGAGKRASIGNKEKNIGWALIIN